MNPDYNPTPSSIPHDPIHLDRIATEGINPDTRNLDIVDTLEMVTLINREDQKVALAVQTQLPAIARAVDAIVAGMEKGGRLVYIGAGTSGRLGVLDASECPPTFGVAQDAVLGLMAGGMGALANAQENVEDSEELGVLDLQSIGLKPSDVVCAIAASGRTPYCLGGLRYARLIGCSTLSIVCSPDSPLEHAADIAIVPVVGPEAVSGSTRMKAGTAQKMVLNMLSTGSMVRMGKVFGNLMVDVKATNAKLRVRSENIVMQATGLDREKARIALSHADGKVKTTICMLLTGFDRETAEWKMTEAKGKLRLVLADTHAQAVHDSSVRRD